MTDWTKTTGSTGTMMIRDTGDVVEFWFKAGYSNDWYNGLDFSYTVDGDTTNKSINYPTGAKWYKVGSDTAHGDQTVTFKLKSDTNISGIGGPTTFSHSVQRDSVPSPPSTPVISGIKATSVVVTFKDGSNNGDAIDSRQITYGTSPDGGTTNASSDGSTTISGLSPNTTYYFWARCHNSEGWGHWSAKASAKTLAIPTAPSAPFLSSITATSVDVAWDPPSSGGSTITDYEIGWNIGPWDPDPSNTVAATSPHVITGLDPGTPYNISVRAKNSVGWSAWGKSTSMRTVAGAYILVGTTWKLAIPYVNVGGVWKPAEAWSRNAGVWKKSI